MKWKQGRRGAELAPGPNQEAGSILRLPPEGRPFRTHTRDMLDARMTARGTWISKNRRDHWTFLHNTNNKTFEPELRERGGTMNTKSPK